MFAGMYYGVYFFFASLMLLAAVYVFFLIPETKGIPLESMDRLFSRELPARRAHAVVLADLRYEDQEFRRQSVVGEKGNVEENEVVVGVEDSSKHVEKV